MKKITFKKILNLFLTLFIVFVGIVIALLAIQKITGKKIVPYSVLWVLTPSMEDTIPQKSYVLVKTVNAKEVKVDDIITSRSRDGAIAGYLNTHRVVEIIGDNEEFVTKGDANPIPDKTHVFAQDIEAKYIKNLPILSFFGRVFTTTYGFVICMVLMLAGTVFWFYRYFVSKRKPKTENAETSLSSEDFDRLVKEEVKRLEDTAEKSQVSDASAKNSDDNSTK